MARSLTLLAAARLTSSISDQRGRHAICVRSRMGLSGQVLRAAIWDARVLHVRGPASQASPRLDDATPATRMALSIPQTIGDEKAGRGDTGNMSCWPPNKAKVLLGADRSQHAGLGACRAETDRTTSTPESGIRANLASRLPTRRRAPEAPQYRNSPVACNSSFTSWTGGLGPLHLPSLQRLGDYKSAHHWGEALICTASPPIESGSQTLNNLAPACLHLTGSQTPPLPWSRRWRWPEVNDLEDPRVMTLSIRLSALRTQAPSGLVCGAAARARPEGLGRSRRPFSITPGLHLSRPKRWTRLNQSRRATDLRTSGVRCFLRPISEARPGADRTRQRQLDDALHG